MGRKKLALQKIENAASRQVAFVKRKDSLLKKSRELAVLCDADVALIMFSPAGRLSSFATHGRVEDILLRFVNRPDELRGGRIDQTNLSEKLKQLKHDGEMIDKISKIQDLEDKLEKLNCRRGEAIEKMRYYEPNLESIHSTFEIEAYQQFLTSALQRIKLSKEKLLCTQLAPSEKTTGIIEMNERTGNMNYTGSVELIEKRYGEEDLCGTCSCMPIQGSLQGNSNTQITDSW